MRRINRYLRNIAEKYRESQSSNSCYYWVQVKSTLYRIRCSDHFNIQSTINDLEIIKIANDTYVIKSSKGFSTVLNEKDVLDGLKGLILILPSILGFANSTCTHIKNLMIEKDKLKKENENLSSRLNDYAEINYQMEEDRNKAVASSDHFEKLYKNAITCKDVAINRLNKIVEKLNEITI